MEEEKEYNYDSVTFTVVKDGVEVDLYSHYSPIVKSNVIPTKEIPELIEWLQKQIPTI